MSFVTVRLSVNLGGPKVKGSGVAACSCSDDGSCNDGGSYLCKNTTDTCMAGWSCIENSYNRQDSRVTTVNPGELERLHAELKRLSTEMDRHEQKR